MNLVTFDPLRVWDIPGVHPLKADAWQQQTAAVRAAVAAADWILFPEQWQVNALVYGLKKRIFPSVNSYHLGYSKVEMTYAFQAVAPAHVPYTIVLPRTDSSVVQVPADLPFPFVAKEARNAMGRGVFMIENLAQWRQYVAGNNMLYVQEWLPIERDLRIVVVGDQVVAAYWRQGPPGGFYNNVARGGTISFNDIPAAAVDLVRQVAGDLGVDHAGFDVALVDGRPYLLEFNMRFGNQALRQRGIRLGPIILAYLQRRPATAVADVRSPSPA